MSLYAFNIAPLQKTYLLNTTTSPGGALTQVSTGGCQQCCVSIGSSASGAFIAFGQSSAVTANVPTTATPAVGEYLPPWGKKVYTIPPGGWMDAVSTAAGVPVFATPGIGL